MVLAFAPFRRLIDLGTLGRGPQNTYRGGDNRSLIPSCEIRCTSYSKKSVAPCSATDRLVALALFVPAWRLKVPFWAQAAVGSNPKVVLFWAKRGGFWHLPGGRPRVFSGTRAENLSEFAISPVTTHRYAHMVARNSAGTDFLAS